MSGDVQAAARQYRAEGLTTRAEVLDRCVEVAREDKYVRNQMEWRYGSVGAYADAVYEAMKETPA